MVKIGTAEKNFPKREQCGLVQWFLYLKRRCDHGAVYLPAQQGFCGPWGGVVGNAEMNAGLGAVKSGKPIQQEQMQGGFAGGNGDAAGFQTAIPADLALTQPQLLKRSGSPPIKPQPFRRQGNAAVGADEELAAQVLLQIVHAAGDSLTSRDL